MEYSKLVKEYSPNSTTLLDTFNAFWTGGLICVIGQLILGGWGMVGLSEDQAATATSMSMILLGALLTGIGIYDRIAKFAGAGTIVPITGFSNSVVSPALEFKTEGFVMGVCANMFKIAGPVLVYGIGASVVYGFIYWIMSMM
ncbi:MAG: stage V sporulation protein AC [Oscillospiraceae bacterium]|nr:stage V sporulation protein AC [Oscillospiraceae bacterium]